MASVPAFTSLTPDGSIFINFKIAWSKKSHLNFVNILGDGDGVSIAVMSVCPKLVISETFHPPLPQGAILDKILLPSNYKKVLKIIVSAMANVEETSNANIIFRGTDGNECEAFVVAIRYFAFAKGKDEDYNWMLRYATTQLRGKALRWHAKLDLSVQQSWHLFVQALFEEYPLVEEQDGGGRATPVWTATTFSPTNSTAVLPGSNHAQNTASIPQSVVDVNEIVPPTITQSSDTLSPSNKLIPPPRLYDPSSPGYYMGRL